MASLSLRQGWSNVVVALSLAIIPFLMFASLEKGERTAKVNPSAVAALDVNDQ